MHTEYSLLDGAVRIPDADEAGEGTRHAGRGDDRPRQPLRRDRVLPGAAKKAGVKPIIGCEIYLAPGSMEDKKEIAGRKRATHLTLLAETNEGYENLSKLVSKATSKGSITSRASTARRCAKYAKGIICLSGCISGPVNELLLERRSDEAREEPGRARRHLRHGKHLRRNPQPRPGAAAQVHAGAAQAWRRNSASRPVAANDVHFLNRDDHEAHDVMICIGTAPTAR